MVVFLLSEPCLKLRFCLFGGSHGHLECKAVRKILGLGFWGNKVQSCSPGTAGSGQENGATRIWVWSKGLVSWLLGSLLFPLLPKP